MPEANLVPGGLPSRLSARCRQCRPSHVTHPLRKSALLLAAALALPLLAACQSQGASAPPGSISTERVISDLLVSFTDPPVLTSIEAGSLLDKVEGPIRYVVKRPMSGGVWLVTAISQDADVTVQTAVDTLRAAPRILSVDAEDRRRPARSMPSGRDMPPDPSPDLRPATTQPVR